MTCGAGPSSAPCCCHLHALSHRVHGLRWSSTVQGEGDGGDGWRSGQPFDLRLASPANSPWMLQKLVPVSATLLPPPITINSITVAGMGNKEQAYWQLQASAVACTSLCDRWQRQVVGMVVFSMAEPRVLAKATGLTSNALRLRVLCFRGKETVATCSNKGSP
jgi:hypothetical protein